MVEVSRPVRVGVDTGTIQIARNPDRLRAGLELFDKISRRSLGTARAAWDGHVGAIETPSGDGLHEVQLRLMSNTEWEELLSQISDTGWMGPKIIILESYRREETGKPFDLFLGDVGRMDGWLSLPEHKMISFFWRSENLLEFHAVQEDRSKKDWRPR